MITWKKTCALLLFSGLLAIGAKADTPFKVGTKYKITSLYGGTGSVTVGSLHGSDIVLLYQKTAAVPDDGYWLFESTGKANTWRIKNALTGQYLQHRPARIEGAIKGLILSDAVNADSTSWELSGEKNRYNIINVADDSQWLNLRTDGTLLLGTYDQRGANDNELFAFYDEQGSPVESEGSTSQPDDATTTLPALLDSLYVNGKPAVYDQAGKRYLCSLSASLRESEQADIVLTYALGETAAAANGTLEIDGQPATSGQSLQLTGLSGDRSYPIRLVGADGSALAEATVEFTFLPLVVLNSSADCNGTTYTPGDIRVIDPDTPDYEPVLNSNLRYRGASAQNYQKKAFAVKLKDSEGKSMDRSFFGLREDNNWILDAMAVDKARMRNRVSTDLWNDYSTRPYYADEEPKMSPGTHGRFVEVVLNGNYHGLYCMTEKMDRKQLKLKKIKQEDGEADVIRGVLYKSEQWSYEVLMGHESDSRNLPGKAPSAYDNTRMTWSNYEMDYPDIEDGESIDWGPLYNAVNFVATSTDNEFVDNYQHWFDMPVWTDYYLFLDVILATDNHGKNMFFLNYNITDEENGQKISLAPWDLDGTWGRRWDGTNDYTSATSDFDAMVWRYEHGQHTLYYRLQTISATQEQWQQTLAERYATLRQGVFDPDSLKRRFTAYADLMTASGAVRREDKRWAGSDKPADITDDVAYITNWIDQRMASLDEKYGYDPSISVGVASPAATDYLAVTGGKGALLVTTSHPTTLYIYNVSGQLVRTARVTAGPTEIGNLLPGVYTVNRKKVAVY